MRPTPTTAASLLAALCVLASSSCSRGPSENLLLGRQPGRAEGVPNPRLITDGILAADGADWNAPAATVLQSEGAFVEYDLGRPARIDSALIQADNNDDYVVSVSDDGANYRELWTAHPVAAPGLRARSTDGLRTRARWVRLTARGGDHVYSVTELQVWSGALPALASQPSSELLAARVRAGFIYLVLAFAALLFATRRESSARRVALGWLLPASAAVALVLWIAAAWPLGGREVSAARAAAAAIALVALLRGWDRVRRAPPHQGTVVAACAVAAALAFACFYNLGRPQFWHHGKQRPMFVHVTDMRIYQPFAKYFDELGYDGIYLASALAFAEDERGGSIESIGATKIRDLRDYRLRTVLELKSDMLKVKQQFSPARWVEFKRDLTFFRAAMGPAFITTMDDHGANAPPAWLGLARLVIGHVPANETTLTIAGLLDAVLLLAMAWAIAVSFGLLPMLVAMTVFGATDLYMFGTNWTGATLRHDWLVLLGFAACALRKERWRLAGALLGTGTMLRLVPAVGLMGIGAPALAWIGAEWARGRRPGLRAVMAEHRAAVRVAAAAAATMAAIFLVTGLLYSFGAWRDWWMRIQALNSDFGINEVNLRMLIAGAEQTAVELVRERRPLFVLAWLASFVLVLYAARKRPVDDAMLLALPLVPVVMNAVNYHDHFLFLLVLLGARRGLLAVAAPLLLMCVGGYWLDLETDWARHFELLSVLLFATFAWVYAEVIHGGREAAPQPIG